MKKAQKLSTKIISIILAVSLVFAAVPILSVSAATPVLQDDLTQVANLSEILADPSQNLTHSWGNSANKGEALAFYSTYTSGSKVDQNFTTRSENVSKMTDGLLNTRGDMGGHSWFNSDKQYVEGYTDLTFNFPVEANITNFLFASGSDLNSDRWTWEYAVYASNDLDTLYNSANLLYHYNEGCKNTPTVGQYITFPQAVKAKYFGLRIINGCNPESAENNRDWASSRIAEMAIIGSCNIPDEYWVTAAKNVDPCIDALNTEYNLLDNEFSRGSGQPGSFVLDGFDGTSRQEIRTKVYIEEGLELFDHTLDTGHTDISGVGFYDKESGKYTDGAYMTITLALREQSAIDKVFIANADTAQLQTREYEIYTSNKLDNLYEAKNKVAYYFNSNPSRNQAFVLDTPKIAKFVGVKILKSVQPNFIYDKLESYVRIAEIAVFGEPYVNQKIYSVKSSVEGLVQESGTAEFDTELTFTAPLTKNGYSLRGWTVNGEAVTDYEKDIDANKATINVTIEEDLEIIAEYSPDDRELTSDKGYATYNGMLRVPSGRILQELKYGFHQYPRNIAAKNGNVDLGDGDYINSGNTVNLLSNGEAVQSLSVVIAGDINRNNKLEVSEIVELIDKTINVDATEEEKFIFDLNNSGKLTVSDVVSMRNTILTAPTEPVNYSSTTTTQMANLDYKQQGRNTIRDDGKLFIDWTAAGFSFNADVIGNVVLNVTQQSGGKRFYTAFVDGVETTVDVSGSGSQDIIIANNLKRGVHSIGFYKQQASGSGITINSVKVNGKVLPADELSDLFIEFVGDSITAGASNLVKYGEEDNPPERTSDAFNSYSTQTARILGADWSNIAVSGGTLVKDTINTPAKTCLPEEYVKNNRVENVAWDFQNNRTADIVVVNFGVNDSSIVKVLAAEAGQTDEEFFADRAVEFAHYLMEVNGEDVQIIFAHGLMTTNRIYADDGYELAVEKLKAEGFNNACYFRLPTNRDGGGGHPSVPGARIAAEALAEFINENYR